MVLRPGETPGEAGEVGEGDAAAAPAAVGSSHESPSECLVKQT